MSIDTPEPHFRFEVLHQSTRSSARVGRIVTPHGTIETPHFVPVGTNAALKCIDTPTSEQLGIDLLFCNTYHLMLHPGTDTIRQAGGVHQFMGRTKPIITDSGGFQVFSLMYKGVAHELKSRGKKQKDGSILRITEDGVLFRSYRDGQRILLTPESSVQAQKNIGADIIIPLDELPPYHTSRANLKASLERTHRWELRSLEEHKRRPQHQAMYGVIHGGTDPDLRRKSATTLGRHPFDGWAIGGSMGKTRDDMHTMLCNLLPHLDPTQPRHLLGIGDTLSLSQCIPLGIDTFDSAYPTQCARHGVLFSDNGPIKIQQRRWREVFTPISMAPVASSYSAAYLHHLFKAHEATAHTIASIHNICYMSSLMGRYRQAIWDNRI